MHVVFRERHGLEETDTPTDLGQEPADLVVLSFSDSDLGAFAAGWHRAGGALPSLRLANLAALRHPLSVDTYIEKTLAGAKGILIRLIGGVPYWAYGLAQVEQMARRRGIALAVLPGDGRPDPQLDAASTLPPSTLARLARLCETGGAVAAQAALAQLALAAGLYAGPVPGSKALPEVGGWTPADAIACPAAFAAAPGDRPRVLVVFYRTYLAAHDLEPVEALFAALEARGFAPFGLFAPSLKAPGAAGWLARWAGALAPAAIVNVTAFSARDGDRGSPLDAAGVPVFQVALATSTRAAWEGAARGLSPADLAMHVVLPEVDGRLFAGVVSFKEATERDAALGFARMVHRAEPERVGAVADRVAAWVRLQTLPAAETRLALVLSTYPGKEHRMAHAVGLDALASADAMLADLATAGYATGPAGPLADALSTGSLSWPLADYRMALTALPPALRSDLEVAWGDPEEDSDCRDGIFRFRAVRRGNALVALQPERGEPRVRDGEYHDLSRVPRHAYVAFYLWMRRAERIDALVHIGAHGTLEWLPGKAVALSAACWPEALTGDLPVVYPFIVNDPGEAAQAKRRLGAVTVGHIPPPLRRGAGSDRLARLEALLDEFSNADGLDPKRRERLHADIREEARAAGVEEDLGLGPEMGTVEAITRIDRFVCDVKDSRFGDGLHVFGRAPAGDWPEAARCAEAERDGLLAALDGRRVAAGPSGSPWRGRADVLPTGRNLFTTDPRAVPSRAAYAQGVRLAEELLRRHLQDHGDWPRGLVVDLWGSATMRTGGEEFAMALHLLGAKPVWDEESGRVAGVEILPLAVLDRPRIDVTLRVSGLFRDVFPTLSTLFGQAVRALGARDEPAEMNPYAGEAAPRRVYGPAPGGYGLGLGDAAEDFSESGRARAGEAWLDASQWALNGADAARDRAGIEARVAGADAFVHLQDLPETDLLLAADYAAHEAGFAAAKALTGGRAALYHLDATDAQAPRARSLGEEVARVVRGRAANPAWIAGMMRHGFRGAGEIAATLDHMAAFAHLAGAVPAHLFDLYHDATLGRDDVRAFLKAENPAALAAMEERFAALHAAGLWRTRRNSILASLRSAP
ncbi:cobaltochelatase subunit CobN [Azospirillum sp. RWY-5-1]|uniref:Cobaltochelatase subunit CobN n=1 Tax=Azospirillum oleiclasticum TaxID=2735135 RepID=A0ABX2TDP3_9PROT|nr:cobaltochelatase subunit CobN [Azospirillum oleiclasticum]NYZ15168.1 cobaltochelatase subunit CobN [Azospirillum oleiclasticum]NYZ21411.1 cobaltochelatase subunit CobN [Azospirillum oleiclasticum]